MRVNVEFLTKRGTMQNITIEGDSVNDVIAYVISLYPGCSMVHGRELKDDGGWQSPFALAKKEA